MFVGDTLMYSSGQSLTYIIFVIYIARVVFWWQRKARFKALSPWNLPLVLFAPGFISLPIPINLVNIFWQFVIRYSLDMFTRTSSDLSLILCLYFWTFGFGPYTTLSFVLLSENKVLIRNFITYIFYYFMSRSIFLFFSIINPTEITFKINQLNVNIIASMVTSV